MKPTLSVYERLCHIKWLSKSYSLKFLFIAFLGIHIPLIGIICYLLMGPAQLKPLPVFLIVLVLTLVATALTLYLLNGLLFPLKQSKLALENYLGKQELPTLPQEYIDEAGILMNKLQDSLLSLDTMIQEKRDLASLLSHDLKQPLAVISNTAEAIALTTDPAQLQKFSTNLKKMATDQIQMLEGVLQMLNFDMRSSQEDQLTTVPIEALLNDVVEGVAMQAELKAIRIEPRYHFDGLVPVHLELFPQVVKNILHNAIKFSYPGAIINVEVTQENDWLKIAITDKGKGFSEEQGKLLFDRFTKAGQKGTEGEASTGIGLHICQKMINMQGGKIAAYSAGPEMGATFTISIPNIEEQEFEIIHNNMQLAVA
jgi:signal transduction histidine kinase